jgi:hypothetical protein
VHVRWATDVSSADTANFNFRRGGHVDGGGKGVKGRNGTEKTKKKRARLIFPLEEITDCFKSILFVSNQINFCFKSAQG